MKTWNSTFKYGILLTIYIYFMICYKGIWAMGYGRWAMGYGLRAMGYGLWAAYYTCLGMVPRHFHGAHNLMNIFCIFLIVSNKRVYIEFYMVKIQ